MKFQKRNLLPFLISILLVCCITPVLGQLSYNLHKVPGISQDTQQSSSHSLLFPKSSSEFSNKEINCIRTGQIIGMAAGSLMGTMTMYWKATGESGVHGPFWQSVVTGVPSILIGSYVGNKTSEWATKQMINGQPNIAKALLKGAGYGALQGAIIFTSSLIPLFIVGHYLGVIDFAMSGPPAIFKIMGLTLIGGAGYGGIFGLMGGAALGPSFSLYLNF